MKIPTNPPLQIYKSSKAFLFTNKSSHHRWIHPYKLMACRIQGIVLPLHFFEASNLLIRKRSNGTILNGHNKPSLSAPYLEVEKVSVYSGKRRRQRTHESWKIGFALDVGGGIADNGGGGGGGGGGGSQDENSGGGGGMTPRLGRLVSAGGREVLLKLNSARKNFPMKVFLLLLGFYTANALATILGQTGDWDVLVAGVVVAAIEGIGILMYKRRRNTDTDQSSRSSSTNSGRFQTLVVMINYWKAGLCLGLFVDAFKLGS